MIHPDSNLHWIDLKAQRVYTGAMSKLFQMYSHRAKNITSDLSEVIFDSDNVVKVTDYTGWTDAISIRRRSESIVNFCLVRVDATIHHLLVCTPETLIPVYDGTKISGFHGETKHRFVIKYAGDIEDGDLIKMHLRGEGRNTPLYPVTSVITRQEMSPTYQLLTKSGFYSVNRFYLWGREEIPADYCDVCPANATKNCAGCRK